MQRYATLATVTLMVIAFFALTASAQIPLNMSYQARLADSTGNPVPDGPYDLEFNFYSDSTGGVPVWTEQFFGVITSNGFFSVMTEPIDLGALGGPLFMEVTVGGEILSPRSRMASVPYSAISHRVQGDIITNEGFMFLVNADGDSCVEMSGDGVQSSFKMMDPVDKREGFEALVSSSGTSVRLTEPIDSVASIEMGADNTGSIIKVKYTEPIDKPGVEIRTEDGGIGGQAGIYLFNPQPEPPAGDPVIEMKTMLNDAAYFAMNNLSGAEVGPLLEMTTDPTASSRIKIHSAQPTFSGRVEIQAQYTDGANMTLFREGLTPHNEIKAMDLRVSSDIGGEFNIYNYASDVEQELLAIGGSPSAGASFKMFNPQPEPPARLMLDMNTDQYGATFAMAAPQAAGPGDQITDPMVEVIADSSGGAINLYNEISKYMGLEPCPFEPGGLLQMYDPVADAVKFEVVTTEDGTGIDIYDEIGKYMGLDPSPFTPGGLLQMYDPVADAVKFEVSTTEDGTGIDIYDEIGKYMGFDPSPFTPGGYLYMIESSGLAVDTNMTLGSDGYMWVENGVTIGSNTNTGSHTLVMGANTGASGDNCFAGGREAQANHDHCFVWSDNPFGPSMVTLQSSAENQFLVRSTGMIAFYTNMNLTYGVSLGPGDYAWNSVVPPLTSRNSRDVDGANVLDKIKQLPVKRFSADGNSEHISPSPEDFNRLFDLGTAQNHISMQDQSGIALAGIKEMINIINDLKDKNAELERRIAELESK